jgi:predicted ATPase
MTPANAQHIVGQRKALGLLPSIGDKKILLVLDNCEDVTGVAAALACESARWNGPAQISYFSGLSCRSALRPHADSHLTS